MDGDRVIASTLCDRVRKTYVQIQVGTRYKYHSTMYKYKYMIAESTWKLYGVQVEVP